MDLRQYLPVIAGLSEMQMIRLPSNGTVTKALAVRNPPSIAWTKSSKSLSR